jgi:uncharacterized protein YndB with AHSA1/START domain
MAKAPTTPAKLAGITDARVREKTGKNWAEWLGCLDRVGAKGMTHRQIVQHLQSREGCTEWWSQWIAVAYERQRGRREPCQRRDGFVAGASKTVPVPVARLYRAWSEPSARERWLPKARLAVRKATANRSLRITWLADGSHVDVYFTAKGPGKSQVAIQHRKLADAARAGKAKAFWTGSLKRLAVGLAD